MCYCSCLFWGFKLRILYSSFKTKPIIILCVTRWGFLLLKWRVGAGPQEREPWLDLLSVTGSVTESVSGSETETETETQSQSVTETVTVTESESVT